MKKLNCSFLAAVLTAGALLTANQTQAQGILKITEVESDEASGKVDGTSKPDWFEVMNVGDAAINMTGYTMDDDSDSYSLSVALNGISSIAPGEVVVYFESSGGFTVQNFLDWWGSSLASTQIGTYSGSGVSLGKTGDQVNIFDSSEAAVDGVVLGNATTGSTFFFDPTGASGRSAAGISQAGIGGAFTSNYSDIGSPGVVAAVPEPSTMALAGLSALGLAGFRRWQNRKA